MRLVLALLLASEPALAAVVQRPGQGGPARGAPAAPVVTAPPSLGLSLPIGAVPGASVATAGAGVQGEAAPLLPASAVPQRSPERPASAAGPAALPGSRLVERLGEAAQGSLETVAAAASSPAEASRASGDRDFAVLLGEAAPVRASEGGAPAPPAGPPQDPYPGSLRRMFAGTMAFKVGMEAMTTSVPFVAMSSLGGATAVALLVVVTYGLAQAVFGSFTGALTDRFRAGRVLTGAVAAQGVSLGAILALSAVGALSPWMLFPLYALVGGAVGVAETARRTVPALILGRDQEPLRRYNARLHRFYEIAGVSGSALAGLLIWKFGAMNALIVGPPALLAAALVFRGVRHGAPSKPVSEPGASGAGRTGARQALGRYWNDLRLGAGTVLRDPRLRWVSVAMILPQVVHRIFEGMLLPIYAKGVLTHEFLSPALLTASNLGEFLGATLLLRWAAKRPGSSSWVRWGAYGLLALWALSLVQALGVSPLLGVALLAPAVLASSMTWASSHLSLETEVQERVPREVQPRVFSLLYGAFVVLAAASSYLIGRFLDAVPLASGFLGLNAALLGLAALVWTAARRLRPAPPPARGPGGAPPAGGPARPVPAASAPFPDLAGSLARTLGIARPPRRALPPLPALPDPDALPRKALGMLLDRMAARQNWGDVAYAASGITTVEGKIRAQWMSEDSRAEVREYFAALSETQRSIAEAAFAGGLAETPAFHQAPEMITLEWVRANYPPRRVR